jgi:hypothetical protein
VLDLKKPPETTWLSLYTLIVPLAFLKLLWRAKRPILKETIFKTWGDEARSYVNEIDTYNLLDAIRKVAVSMGYHQAILKVNQAIIERLSHHGRGISTSTFPQAGDYNKIRITPDKYPAAPIDNNVLKQYGLAIDSRGLLEKVDIEMTGVGRVLGTVPPETPQGQGRFNSSLAAPFTMPGMVNPQPIMQSIEQQGIQPTDTPRHH